MANTRRENRLEELGRVDAEKAYTAKGRRNLRDEKHRIRKELKRGGRAGKPWGSGPKPGSLEYFQSTTQKPTRKGKAGGGVIKGALAGAKKVTAPGTHIRNVASGIKHGATKLIKGLPKIAKRGWK